MTKIKELIQILQEQYNPEDEYIGNIITYEEILEKYDDIQKPIVLNVLLMYKNSIDSIEDLENILQDDSQFKKNYEEE